MRGREKDREGERETVKIDRGTKTRTTDSSLFLICYLCDMNLIFMLTVFAKLSFCSFSGKNEAPTKCLRGRSILQEDMRSAINRNFCKMTSYIVANASCGTTQNIEIEVLDKGPKHKGETLTVKKVFLYQLRFIKYRVLLKMLGNRYIESDPMRVQCQRVGGEPERREFPEE